MLRRAAMCAVALTMAAATPAKGSESDWDKASDIGRGLLVVTALGFPAVQGDWEGTKQAGFSLGSTYAVTTLLKHTINEERPDGSDDKSFPSGHTSSSFAAAATLHKRHGWKVGVPAHAVAAFVGVARVKADKHFVHDVLVGAAIGEAAGWLLTSKKNEKVQWLPWGDTRGGGMTVVVRY
jgi:membrane-associated phospholipid phosphatase